MENRDFCCYEFNEFRLDARRRALTKNGEKVPLSARNFDLLLFMVENGGRILEHDELLDKVWAGTFVEQATLKKGISALRQILVEDPENEFIKTIPRRGYSFVSPVSVVPDNPAVSYVRETEREIIVEELVEIDDESEDENKNIIDIPSTELKSLPAAAPQKHNFTRTAILSSVGIILLVLALFGLKPYFSKAVQSQFSVENVRVNRITNTGKLQAGAVISPDGTYIVYSLSEKDGVSLWVRQVSANNGIRLVSQIKGGFWGFSFAPDNSYVYYILNNVAEPQKTGLYKIPLFGGESQKLKENVSSFSVSPDGKRLVLVKLSDRTQIVTVNSDGEDEREVTSFTKDFSLLGNIWTPDGTAILCTIRKNTVDKPTYYVSEVALEDGKETVIIPPQNRIMFGAVWMPDKSAILAAIREPNADIRQIWQYFVGSQEWKRVTNDNNSYKLISLTRDGKTIVSFQESRLASIWIADGLAIDRKTAQNKSLLNSSDSFRQITDGFGYFDWLGWLGSGRLMYSTTEQSNESIFSINADGTNPKQLTGGDDGIWVSPNVSGNGQSIGYLSNRSGYRQVWRIDDDGKNLTKMTQVNQTLFNVHILRDNSTFLYVMQQPSGINLFKQNADGQTSQLTDFNTGAFAVSPDEKLLAIENIDDKSGTSHVELRTLEDGKLIKTFNFLSVRQMRFTPDGKNLAYDALHGDFRQIMIQPLDGSEPFALTDFQSDNIFSFDWSQDGNHLAVIRGKELNDAVIIKTDAR